MRASLYFEIHSAHRRTHTSQAREVAKAWPTAVGLRFAGSDPEIERRLGVIAEGFSHADDNPDASTDDSDEEVAFGSDGGDGGRASGKRRCRNSWPALSGSS